LWGRRSDSDSDPSYCDGGDRARLFGGGLLEPEVVLMFSEARGCLVPREDVFGAVLGMDRKDDKDGVVETEGWGDKDFLVVDDTVSCL